MTNCHFHCLKIDSVPVNNYVLLEEKVLSPEGGLPYETDGDARRLA